MHTYVSRAMHKRVTCAADTLTPRVLYELGARVSENHGLMTFFIVYIVSIYDSMNIYNY
jgi:hypothetical protein